MKKILLSVAIIATSLTSCTKEDVIDSAKTNNEKAISFGTYSNITKGNPYDSTDEFEQAGNSFGVTAFISSNGTTPYLGNTSVGAEVKFGTDWEHVLDTEIRYWPNTTETLDFIAYTPFIDASAAIKPTFNTTTGFKITGYTVPAGEADHVDFMYATAFDEKREASAIDDVILQFKHGLVQVHFAAKTATSNMYVDIAENGVTIHNINSVGDFTVPYDDATDASWSNQGTLSDYQFISAATTINGDDNLDAITIQDKSLMLLPQTFEAWNPKAGSISSQTNAYISIKCKIYLADKSDATEAEKNYQIGDTDNYVTIYMPISSSTGCSDGSTTNLWEMAKKITFNLTFGGGYDSEGNPILRPITFDAEVTSWGEETPTIEG